MASKQIIQQCREMLEQRRSELSQSVRSQGRELSTGVHTDAGADSADLATNDFAVELFGTFLEKQAGNLEQIENALERIDQGTYGKCQQCNKAITAKRLKAMPWAATCLSCQSASERPRRHTA